MSDDFGKKRTSRTTEGGKFYAWPVEDVPANAIYVPLLSGGFFGVSEIAVPAKTRGAFSYVGTFDFARPNDWNSVQGQPVYYTPSSTVDGDFSAAKAANSIFVGWELATDIDGNGNLIFDPTFIRLDIARTQDVVTTT